MFLKMDALRSRIYGVSLKTAVFYYNETIWLVLLSIYIFNLAVHVFKIGGGAMLVNSENQISYFSHS